MNHVKMNDYDVDDVAFLTGDTPVGTNKRAMYEPSGMERVRRVILSPKIACFIAIGCFLGILSIALIAAFARPFVSCPCSGQRKTAPSTVNETTTLYPTTATATNGEPFPWKEIRLPDFILPLHYSIYIHPNLTTFTFEGDVNITFKMLHSSNFIVLHIKDLELEDTTLVGVEDIRVIKTLEYQKHEQLYVQFSHVLVADKEFTLKLGFNGNLTEKLEGFYLSSYTPTSGNKTYLATTHFEPTFARAAFPCFDEPSMKAKFQMSITRDEEHFALFNTPVQWTEKLPSGLITDHFNETVKMSTYLVAFVVCDYKNITTKTNRGIQVSVFAPPPQIYQARFASTIATKVIDFYEEFFGIPYPLPKHDLIAIPDFGAGAMENWGLTTYRETAILADFNETAIIKQQQVAMTLTHELAHQWFGNLVTMQWWNDLWLNEGFASFVEYLGAEYAYPDWKMLDQFVIEKTQPALQMDSLPSSHPISVEVDDPSEIESIFDPISYNKGAAIIYMLESFLGKPALKIGLKNYLNKFQYANAKTEDLWDVLREVSREDIDVKAVMDTWTQQMGFPLITINQTGDTIHATQQRFLVGIRPEEDFMNSEYISKYSYKWHVPLTYITSKSSKSKLVWMKPEEEDVNFKVEKGTEWIKFNVNQTGFYRVTYDMDMWQRLTTALQNDPTVFSAADRASLLNDAFTLARNNRLNPIIPLNMTNYLAKERDYIPWVTTLDHLSDLNLLLREKPSYNYFKQYARKLLEPIVSFVRWTDNGTHLERLLRPSVLHEAVTYGNEIIIREAKRLFNDWKTKNISISPNLRGVVYMVGIEYGTYEDWKFCWDQYQSTQLPSEKVTFLIALGTTKDPWILSQFLEFSLQREKIRPQNLYLVLKTASGNPIGRDLTWRFVRSNWQKLVDLFGEGSFSMSNIILETTNKFVTRFEYDEVNEFFENKNVGSGKRALQSSLETIQTSIKWLEANEKIVAQWLQHQVTKI